ncbi:CC-NBS-LRR resistance protein, partial [Trifolium medium]|nr:CC-NBS-LRR resistance protein [Trifolium medium]
MGKTTLAQLVYNDQRMEEHFEIKDWVHVSESYSLGDLVQSILRSTNSFAAEYTDDIEMLQRQLQRRLAGKKYLLVLDDVCKMDGLENFVHLFKFGSSGSKVIVTTRDTGVASIIRSTRLLHLKQLEGDNNIKFLLRLSYLNFSSNLKRCFSYCSIFPKGYEFEKDELIKLWMAEGLLKCWGRDKNEEESGNEFFDDLVSISFFQRSVIMPSWTGKYYFIMHDLVNDLAKSVSGEFLLRIEVNNVQDISERTRHIWCCLDLKDGDRKLEHIHKIKGLQSLKVEAQSYGDQRFKISTN